MAHSFFFQQNRHSLGVRCQEATAEHAADTNAVGVGEQLHIDVAYLAVQIVDAGRNRVAWLECCAARQSSTDRLRRHINLQGDGFLLTGIDGGKCVCDQLDGCGFDCGAAETQFDFTLHAVHAAAFSGAGLDVTADDLCVYTATIGVVDLRHVYDLAVRHGELHLFHAVCTVLLLPGVEELHRRLALCHQFPGENGMLLMSQPDAAADNAANGRLGCTEFHILVGQDVLDGTAFLCGVFIKLPKSAAPIPPQPIFAI